MRGKNVRNIDNFLETSEGKAFRDNWTSFFRHSNMKKYDKNSLPAFSYLEGVRLLNNIGKL